MEHLRLKSKPRSRRERELVQLSVTRDLHSVDVQRLSMNRADHGTPCPRRVCVGRRYDLTSSELGPSPHAFHDPPDQAALQLGQ